MNDNILAIDPGKDYGVALFTYEGELIFSAGASIVDPEATHEIRGAIQRYGVSEVVTERGGWRGQQNAFYVGRSLGVILGMYHLYYNLEDMHYVSPTEWKKTLCKKGNATKDEVIKEVVGTFRLPVLPITSDRADAIGIGYHYWTTLDHVI